MLNEFFYFIFALMDIFKIINENRKKYLFPSKEYKALMLKHKDTNINKLELNTCKHYLLNSNKYLKKNIKLSTNRLYTEYMTCLLEKDIKKILNLRSQLEEFDSFVNEFDQLLNNLNFDITTVKSKYMWHDIEILFNTEKKKNDYINKKYVVEDKKFNNQLIIYINKIESKILAFKKLLKKDNTRINCLRNKLKVIYKVVEQFLNFLSENYVESEYLKKLQIELENILTFFTDFNSDLDLCVFVDVEDEIKSCKNIKSKNDIREDLINVLKSFFSPSGNQVDNVPFLPEFYDIAYDYIKYPSDNKNINELLEKMNIK